MLNNHRVVDDLDLWIYTKPCGGAGYHRGPSGHYDIYVLYGCKKLFRNIEDSKLVAKILIGKNVKYRRRKRNATTLPKWELYSIKAVGMVEDFDKFIFAHCGTGWDAKLKYRKFLNEIPKYKAWAMQQFLIGEK